MRASADGIRNESPAAVNGDLIVKKRDLEKHAR